MNWTIPHLVILTDELEGLHAEPELCLVVRGVSLNSRVHITPYQRKRKKKT